MRQKPQCVLCRASLKKEPAFLNLDYRSEYPAIIAFLRKLTRLHNVLESRFVLAFLSMRSSLPKMGKYNQVPVGEFRLRLQDKVDDLDCGVDFFQVQGVKCLRHPHA